MRTHYDFRAAKPNPYARRLKKQLTIRMDPDTLTYFQALAGEFGLPYQTLMNMYLRDCATQGLRPSWLARASRTKSPARGRRPARTRRSR
jgi:hypothetical protein